MDRLYYVSAIDGDRKFLIAGPYDTHQEALGKVDEALRRANDLDPRAWFMAWGTASTPIDYKTPLGAI